MYTTAKDHLLKSYADERAINTHQKGFATRKHIIALLSEFENIMFPGYSGDRVLKSPDGMWLDARLCALRWHILDVISPESKNYETAQDFTNSFIFSLPCMRENLIEDVKALHQGDPASQSYNEVILAYPGLRAILVHRIAHYFWSHKMFLAARLMSEHIHSLTGIDIHPGAIIGKSFHIDHGTGVVIGETCEIGSNVKIYQGVSLGALSVSRKRFGQKRHPTIGDNVIIYAGATILGGETKIGRGSIIGGNVWLIHSVEADSIVENQVSINVRKRNKKSPLQGDDLKHTSASSLASHPCLRDS